jgi:hypothetical protein
VVHAMVGQVQAAAENDERDAVVMLGEHRCF